MILPLEKRGLVVCEFCRPTRSPQAAALKRGGERQAGLETHTYSWDLVWNARRGPEPDRERAILKKTWKRGREVRNEPGEGCGLRTVILHPQHGGSPFFLFKS